MAVAAAEERNKLLGRQLFVVTPPRGGVTRNGGCPVKCGFQVNNKYFFRIGTGHTYTQRLFVVRPKFNFRWLRAGVLHCVRQLYPGVRRAVGECGASGEEIGVWGI